MTILNCIKYIEIRDIYFLLNVHCLHKSMSKIQEIPLFVKTIAAKCKVLQTVSHGSLYNQQIWAIIAAMAFNVQEHVDIACAILHKVTPFLPHTLYAEEYDAYLDSLIEGFGPQLLRIFDIVILRDTPEQEAICFKTKLEMFYLKQGMQVMNDQ